MSKSFKSKIMPVDKQMEERIVQFCSITDAPVKEARKFLEKHGKRVDLAIDAYYNDPTAMAAAARRQGSSTSKLNTLFDKYKDPDSDDIAVDGTIRLCSDLGVDPEDVVLLAVAYELKAPRVAEWTRKGWTEGWKNVGVDSVLGMRNALPRLRERLASDPGYFQLVYNHTFDFARSPGQRSLAIDVAQAFWALLIPHGLKGGALSGIHSQGSDEDVNMVGGDMDDDEGWGEEHTQLWFEYLNTKGGKGVSKDTWAMFLEFIRSIDSKFRDYDAEAAWPSTIDDFVEWARGRMDSGEE